MTQPTLNRRGFLAALAVLPLAGKALDTLAAMKPPLPFWVRNCTVTTGGRFSHITLQKAYRKIQGGLLDAWETEPIEWDEFERVT